MTADIARLLAPRGTLRAAVNYGNGVLAQKDPAGGAPRGVAPALAREIAQALGVPIVYVPYDGAGKVVDTLAQDAWDVAFLAVDPLRAEQIAFSAPYVVIEGSYLVRDGAPYHAVEDLDRPGVRIAVGRGAAYDLFLSRALHHAELVRAPTSAAAIDAFMADPALDAAAGVRQPLLAAAQSSAGLRVVPGRFTAIQQAVALPKARAAGLAWVQALVEARKASGFVARELAASGQRDAEVAPPAA